MWFVGKGDTRTHLFTTPVITIPTTNFFTPLPLSVKFGIKISIQNAFNALLGLCGGRPTSPWWYKRLNSVVWEGKGLQINTIGVRVKVLVKCSRRRVLPNVVQEVDSTDIFSNVKGFATLLKFLEVNASLMICVEIGECIGPPTIGENLC